MRKRFIAVLLLLALLLLCSCSKSSEVQVSVQSVAMITGVGNVGLYDRYAGVVVAGETFRIEKDPDMEVKERLVSAGDEVKEGDILFTYDTEAVSLELDKKQLELEQIKTGITTKTSQKDQLEKEKERASASAQLDYTLQIQELEIDIAEAKLNVTAKEKEIERYTLLLENAEVGAPVDGRVQSVNENGGTDDFGNPLPYITLVQAGAYRVKGSINEQSAGSLMEGTRVLLRSRTDETVTWTGCIERIDWDNPINSNENMYFAMESDEFTGSSKYPFYVTLDSDDGLMLGQHIYIEPDIEEQEEGLLLPAYFINDVDSDPWVWAADSRDRLEKRSLTLGEYDEMTDSWRVTDGLSLDDYIAFPDETCTQGAAVIRYDEALFGGEDEFSDGGFMPEENGEIVDENIVWEDTVEGPVG